MGDLASLHAQARRLIVALRSGLDRLEAQEGVSWHRSCTCNPSSPPPQCRRTVPHMPVNPSVHWTQMPKGAGNPALAKDMQSKLLDLQVDD